MVDVATSRARASGDTEGQLVEADGLVLGNLEAVPVDPTGTSGGAQGLARVGVRHIAEVVVAVVAVVAVVVAVGRIGLDSL